MKSGNIFRESDLVAGGIFGDGWSPANCGFVLLESY